MNTPIRAFGRALRGILDLLVNRVFVRIHSGASVAWEDFDRWLVRHGWRMRDFLGAVMLYIAGVVGVSLAIALFGVVVGEFGFIDGAQWIVLGGMVIGVLGLLPPALMFFMARGLFDLIFRTGEVCAEILEDKNERKNIPARLRKQLADLRTASMLPFSPQVLFVVYLGVFMAFCMFPRLETIKYVLIGAAFGYIYRWLRGHLRIKGWALSHFLYALVMAFMFFATPAWFFLKWLNTHAFVQMWYPTIPGATPDDVRFFGQLGFAAVVLGVASFLLYRTTNSEASDTALDKGDVRRKGFVKKPVRLHKKEDGIVETEYEIVKAKSLSFAWLRSPMFWMIAAVVGFLVWTQVLGNPSPLAGVVFSFKNVMLAGILLGLALMLWPTGKTATAENKGDH